MGIPCYLLKKVNWRPDPDTDRSVFDVHRVDTDEIVAAGVSMIRGYVDGVEPGAMWFDEYTEGFQPAGPDDWSDRDPAGWQTLKALMEEYPERYPEVMGNGLPRRRQSHLFAAGPQLIVLTPGGEWNVDARASNCGLPYDYEHRCWVRHGEPPAVTVDKDGLTCAAGAGSIAIGSYHGFLRGGELV